MVCCADHNGVNFIAFRFNHLTIVGVATWFEMILLCQP